ncbi:hypothetical protein [Methanocorpusculum sp.]
MVIRYKKTSPKQRRTVMAISLVITSLAILVAALGGLLFGASSFSISHSTTRTSSYILRYPVTTSL